MEDATENVTSESAVTEHASDSVAETHLPQPAPDPDGRESAAEEAPSREEAGDGATEQSETASGAADLDSRAGPDSEVNQGIESAVPNTQEGAGAQGQSLDAEQTEPPLQGAFKFSDDTLKAMVEGIIYVAPEPVSFEAISKALEGEDRDRIKARLEDLIGDFERGEHGIEIRQVAGGYKFYSKAEHHEVLRRFVRNLKPPIRLSRQALETLAVIAYRQPVTLPEIEEIRGVDCGGVIHTLLQKKLVLTAGRKNVVGRPILYRSSREFLMHFGLRDISELPSMKEFEELARQALGSELVQESQSESRSELPATSPQTTEDQAIVSRRPDASEQTEARNPETPAFSHQDGNQDTEQQSQGLVPETEPER